MEALNQAFFLALNASAHASPLLVAIAVFLAKWPVAIVMLLAVIVVIQEKTGKTQLSIKLFLTVLLAMAITYVIRESWYHPRPFVIGMGQQLLAHEPTPSFPSFHSTFLFSVGLALLRSGVNRAFAVIALVLGLLTAWARVYLGVHYPFDIIGAFIVASFAALIVGCLPINRIKLRK